MTNEEIKEVFNRRENVMYNGVEYEINAIRYSHSTDKRIKKLFISAELLSLNGSSSMIIARISDIERIDKK